jgi:hypothetical protein
MPALYFPRSVRLVLHISVVKPLIHTSSSLEQIIFLMLIHLFCYFMLRTTESRVISEQNRNKEKAIDETNIRIAKEALEKERSKEATLKEKEMKIRKDVEVGCALMLLRCTAL